MENDYNDRRTDVLRRDIYMKKAGQGFRDEKERLDLYKELMEVALKEGSLCTALDSSIELGDRKMVREIGDKCFNEGWLYDAENAAVYLGDKARHLRIIKKLEGEPINLEESLHRYIGKDLESGINRDSSSWMKSKGFDQNGMRWMGESINLAYNLAGNYDVGIGIAKSGLHLAYAFNKFGLEVEVADSHRRGNGATFQWVGETPNLYGKRVAVFDKDVISGRTSKRALKEIESLEPKSIDLILNNAPPSECRKFGTREENIPTGFTNIIYPNSVTYDSFDKAIERIATVIE